MRGSIAPRLILKDCWLHSPVVILAVLGGGIALALLSQGGTTLPVIGTSAFSCL